MNLLLLKLLLLLLSLVFWLILVKHTVLQKQTYLCLALNLERCPNVSKMLIVFSLSLALSLPLCVLFFCFVVRLLFRRLTTVKSVTCSFSFTHRIHSPQLFIALLAIALYCLSACCCVCLCVSECLIFFLSLSLSISLFLVHLNREKHKNHREMAIPFNRYN